MNKQTFMMFTSTGLVETPYLEEFEWEAEVFVVHARQYGGYSVSHRDSGYGVAGPMSSRKWAVKEALVRLNSKPKATVLKAIRKAMKARAKKVAAA